MKVKLNEITKIGTFPSELKGVIVSRIKEVNGWCVSAEKDKVNRSKWMQIAYANMINTDLPDITEWYENRSNDFSRQAIDYCKKVMNDKGGFYFEIKAVKCEAVMCVYKMLKKN